MSRVFSWFLDGNYLRFFPIFWNVAFLEQLIQQRKYQFLLTDWEMKDKLVMESNPIEDFFFSELRAEVSSCSLNSWLIWRFSVSCIAFWRKDSSFASRLELRENLAA